MVSELSRPAARYPEFLIQRKASILQRQYWVLRTLSGESVTLHWKIGKTMHQK